MSDETTVDPSFEFLRDLDLNYSKETGMLAFALDVDNDGEDVISAEIDTGDLQFGQLVELKNWKLGEAEALYSRGKTWFRLNAAEITNERLRKIFEEGSRVWRLVRLFGII